MTRRGVGRARSGPTRSSRRRASERAGSSASDLLEVYLDRITRHDPTLRAYVTVDVDGARVRARDADDALRALPPSELPPFHGVTLSVKDVVDVAGLPTTHSSKLLSDTRATADDPVVRRFRDAGFIILGKTNVPEFCTTMTDSELNGTCRNPWDPDLDARRVERWCGGRARRRALRGVARHRRGRLGAQPGLVLRTGRPQAHPRTCRRRGRKPATRTTAPRSTVCSPDRSGTRPRCSTCSSGRASPGRSWSPRSARPYAREVQDDPPRLRIAVTTDAPFGSTREPCAEAARTTADLLAGLGHEVEEAAPRLERDPRRQRGADVGSRTGGARRSGPARPGRAAQPSADRTPDDTDGVGALPLGRRGSSGECTLPTVLGPVRPAGHADRRDPAAADHVGAVGPGARCPHGDVHGVPELRATVQRLRAAGRERARSRGAPTRLPIGVQLAGRRLDEALLLRVARQLETARPWSDRRPAAFA